MQPKIDLLGIPVKTFGVMFALGFLAAGAVIARRLKETGRPVDWSYEIIFAGLLGGLVGSRVYYLLQHTGQFTRPVRSRTYCSRRWRALRAADEQRRCPGRAPVRRARRNGGFRCWGLDPQERASRAGRLPTEQAFGAYPSEQWGQLVTARDVTSVPTMDGDYLGYWQAVLACLRGDGPPPVRPEESILLVDTIDTAVRSLREGHPIAG